MGAATMDPPKGREGLAEVPPPRGMEPGEPATEQPAALPDGKQVAVDDVILEGPDQLSFDVGGKAPTGATLTFTGGKVEVDGQWAKGDTVSVVLTGVVDDVGFKDKTDSKTGQVIACTRKQKARIVDVRLAD